MYFKFCLKVSESFEINFYCPMEECGKLGKLGRPTRLHFGKTWMAKTAWNRGPVSKFILQNNWAGLQHLSENCSNCTKQMQQTQKFHKLIF